MKKSNRQNTSIHDFVPLWWIVLACVFSFALPLTVKSQSLPTAPNLLPGQTATRLADGRVLLVGGRNGSEALNSASIWDPATNRSVQLPAKLVHGRAWHSATILPDGPILLFGGIGNDGQVAATSEIFDPTAQTFTSLPYTAITPRAHHTATLLSDGNVLIAGGVGANDTPVQGSELWDVSSPATTTLPLATMSRRDHSATLLPDGKVLLWGGSDGAG